MQEEEIIDINPEYLEGFNGGYILAKEKPEQFNELMQSKNEHSQYYQGLKAGGKEYLREKFKDELQHDREQRERNRNRDKDREKE